MKIGVISDIHSNIIAFKACQSYLEQQGCDEFVYLGDYVSDTPYAQETMEYLFQIKEEKKCYFIRGNREEYMLAQREAVLANDREKIWPKNSASGNLLFTYERLRERDFSFFEQLPISFVYEKEGYPSIRFCHGSPNNARELLYHGAENTKRWLRQIEQPYLVAAHTHTPGISHEHGKCYVNTGSCGIAIADCGHAQCLMLESEERGAGGWKPHLLKVPYNQKTVVKDTLQSGLYDYAPWFINSCIHTFLTGIDKSAELIALTQQKMEQAMQGSETKTVWPDIDECYFEQAAKELDIPDYKGY